MYLVYFVLFKLIGTQGSVRELLWVGILGMPNTNSSQIGLTTTVEQQNMVIEYLRSGHSDPIIQNCVQEQYYIYNLKA